MSDAMKLDAVTRRLATMMQDLARARAERDEAIEALRELHEAHDIGERDLEPYKREAIIEDATIRADAILAKHPKKVTT